MTPEQRRHPDNGIHLCGNCAHQTDVDEITLTPAVLTDWKQRREQAAAEAIHARVVPTFRDDIEKLREHTQRTLRVEFAARQFPSASGGFQLDRAVTIEALQALDYGNIVVLGDAGNGKSVVLLEMAQQLVDSGVPALFLDATDARLADPRSALALEHELEVVLGGWIGGDGIGYLFIDGLDASRPTRAFDALFRVVRSLISTSQQWRVCIATRTYDILHAAELRELFRRSANLVIDQRFQLHEGMLTQVAYITVPDFDADELREVLSRNNDLAVAIEGAPPNVHQLLENPLNLRIAADIVAANPSQRFARVGGRTDLLDLWWGTKVQVRHGTETALQRDDVLRRLITAMLGARELQRPVAEVAADAATEGLLSDGVLVRRGEYGEFVAFPHALVFDYAVYRLLLQTCSLLEFLHDDADRALFALGCLEMRLTQLWFHDRPRFFREILALFANNARRTLLMIAMRIVLSQVSCVEDLAPLLEGGSEAQRAIQYLLRVFIYERTQGRTIGDLKTWTEAVLRMAQRLPMFEHDTLLLLDELLRREGLVARELTDVAQAARLTLHYGLSRDSHAPWFMRMAIPAFIKTYDVEPHEARPLLEQLLDPHRIAILGQYELEPMAYAVNDLHDPDALVAIYERVFSDITVPAGSVHLGSSAIFGMVQDAQQTIFAARYALERRFREFLTENPERAIQALGSSLVWRAESRRAGAHRRHLSIRVGHRDVEVLCDFSNMWDDSLVTHDPAEDMAREFQSWLSEHVASGNVDTFARVLATVAEHGRALWLWRILLLVSSENPTMAVQMLPFLQQSAFLRAYELRDRIAHFLASAYSRLTTEQREIIDEALLGLLSEPDLDEEHLEFRRSLVTSYARELPATAIVAPRLRELAEADRAEHGHLSNEDGELNLRGMRISAGILPGPLLSSAARDEGADEEICAVIDQARPIVELANQRAGEGFILPSKEQLLSLIETLDSFVPAAKESVRAQVYDVISGLVLAGLRTGVFDESNRDELVERLLPILELPDDRTGDDDDEIVRWGSPWRFAEGVDALVTLYSMRPETSLARKLSNLMSASYLAIRYAALRSAWGFSAEDQPIALEMAVRGVNDPSVAVVSEGFSLATGLWRANILANESAHCIIRAYDRVAALEKAPLFSGSLLSVLQELEQAGNAEARERLSALLHEAWRWPSLALQLVIVLSQDLAPTSDPEAAARAQVRLLTLLEAVCAQLKELLARHGGNLDEYPAHERNIAEACLQVVAETAQRVYFVSGTMEHEAGGASHDSGTLSPQQLALLRPILERLADVPLTGGAYYLIKTLNGILSSEPLATIEIAMRAFRGAGGSLARDPVAEPEMRAFVLRYVREHRGLLAEHPEVLSGIMDVVDMFVDGGMPQWMDVVFELDRVYKDE